MDKEKQEPAPLPDEPELPSSFFDQTRPVVELMFAGLNMYRALTADSFRYPIVRQLPQSAYVARTALAGCILQMAHSTLRHFREYQIPAPLPASLQGFPPVSQSACGRLIHDVPVGCIIYAGRTYWAHIDERTELRDATTAIFRYLGTQRLRQFNVDALDPGLDPTARHWSHLGNLLHLLEWNTVADYERDLRLCTNIYP